MSHPLKKYPLLESNPDILGGKICLKNTRISVDIILEWIASGASSKDIVKQFPHIKEEAVSQAVQYAMDLVQEEKFIQIKIAS